MSLLPGPNPKPNPGPSGRNLLLVHGMGGSGKTTLLHHLGHWWQTTGLVDQVFYFGYDQKAWLLWYKGAGDAFAARGGYMYPAFSREKNWWEYLPFVKPPPNEPASVPVGMPTER